MSDNDDIVREFLAESHENLDRLDRDVVELEKHPSDQEILASVFRTIHTIKGTSGFLGFGKLEAVTHVGESLLARLRDGHLSLNPERTTALLAMIDAVRQMLAEIQASGADGNADHSELVANLTLLQQSSAVGVPEGAARLAGGKAERPRVAPAGLSSEPEVVAAVLCETETKPDHSPWKANVPAEAVLQSAGKPGREGPVEKETHESRPKSNEADTIRVDVGLLDKLMNLVGELVLARNQILQFTRTTEETNLVTTGQRLNLIATELQESVMKTRMQPIGSIWSRFPRTVRDVALACGKEVRIQMEGQETELDKTLIEAIKDPMTHLVRNAVDHGIESADVRVAAGKDPAGLLLLRAYHEGGQVNIEISDDGAGLNLARVVEKAVKKGVISAEQAERLSDREAANLIFLPGLSTAEKVTNVSGRGVGMDVVKTNIERIGGTVDLQSAPGKGTTVKVKIPLTLAIVPALIVSTGGQRFAIPQVSLLELVGLEGDEARKRIEMVHGAPVYRLRGSLLPLVNLNQLLKIGERGPGEGARKAADPAGRTEHKRPVAALDTGSAVSGRIGRVNIVVLQADGQKFGLAVDEISDTEEIVVKPLGKHLKNISVFAGATIMGDGKVALILDVLGLAQHAHVVAENRDRSSADAESREAMESVRGKDRHPVLLFRLGESGTMAVDLSAVARLEEFPPESLERAGDRETVQYRGQIMPLVRLSHALGGSRETAAGQASALQVVVVYGEDGRNVGLVVDHILDIVDESYALDVKTARPGVAGSAVIQRHITDIVDVAGLLALGA
ncbi:MAG: chemotaxis protein CheW [Terriglobales bacterium]|jgi:two-component system chemotaxis sensor kinase CheA